MITFTECTECEGEGFVIIPVCCQHFGEYGSCCGDADVEADACPNPDCHAGVNVDQHNPGA